jgi:hypothetical protein
MNSASTRVLNEKLFPFTGLDPAIVAHLKTIATTFTQLYEHRQTADYDIAKQWSRTQVRGLIDSVKDAFKSLDAIRNESIANDYLLSLFVKERQQK